MYTEQCGRCTSGCSTDDAPPCTSDGDSTVAANACTCVDYLLLRFRGSSRIISGWRSAELQQRLIDNRNRAGVQLHMHTIKLNESLCPGQQCISWGAMKVQVCSAAAGTQDCGVLGRQAACAAAGGQLYTIQAHTQTMVQYTGLDLQQGDQWTVEVQTLNLFKKGAKGRRSLQHMDSAG